MMYAMVKKVVSPALTSIRNRAPGRCFGYVKSVIVTAIFGVLILTWPLPSSRKTRPRVDDESLPSIDLIDFAI